MSELDYDIEFVKKEMCAYKFRWTRSSSLPLSNIMRKRTEYFNKITDEDVRQYLADKKEREIKEIEKELEKKRADVLELEKRLKQFNLIQ